MSETAHRHGNSSGHDHSHHHDADAAKTARDPVCGMRVTPETAKHRFEHDAPTYPFCCNGCRTKFEADPRKYLDKVQGQADAPTPVPAGTIYTLPMRPGGRQVR